MDGLGQESYEGQRERIEQLEAQLKVQGERYQATLEKLHEERQLNRQSLMVHEAIITKLEVEVDRLHDEMGKLVADNEHLNTMLRGVYGQGEIDGYVGQCEELERLQEWAGEARGILHDLAKVTIPNSKFEHRVLRCLGHGAIKSEGHEGV